MNYTTHAFAALAVIAHVSCNADKIKESIMETPKTNKEKAVDLLKSIETGDTLPISYINPNKYIQHNLGIADGVEAYSAAIAGVTDYPEKAAVNTARAFTDGNYVLLASTSSALRTVRSWSIGTI